MIVAPGPLTVVVTRDVLTTPAPFDGQDAEAVIVEILVLSEWVTVQVEVVVLVLVLHGTVAVHEGTEKVQIDH